MWWLAREEDIYDKHKKRKEKMKEEEEQIGI